MSKHRTITGFGPSVIKTTGTSTWARFGPCLAKQVAIQAVFTGSSNGQAVKLEGMLSTLTTAAGAFRTIVSIKSSQKGIVLGTSSAPLSFLRANSTKIKAAGSVQVVFAAVT